MSQPRLLLKERVTHREGRGATTEPAQLGTHPRVHLEGTKGALAESLGRSSEHSGWEQALGPGPAILLAAEHLTEPQFPHELGTA